MQGQKLGRPNEINSKVGLTLRDYYYLTHAWETEGLLVLVMSLDSVSRFRKFEDRRRRERYIFQTHTR
jgi:hypothetical protein